jgi:hypothetical protein
MTTVSLTDRSQPAPSVQPSQSGNCMNQICAGPAALLYTLMNEILSVYNKIQSLAMRLSVAQGKVQLAATFASANFTKASAQSQANQLYTQGAQAFVNAGVNGINLGAQVLGANRGKMNEYKENNEVVSQQKTLLGMKPGSLGSGGVGEGERAPFIGPKTEEQTKMITDTRDKLLETQGAERGRSTAQDQDAIDAMSNDQRAKFQADLKDSIKSKEARMNDISNEIQKNNTERQTFVTLAEGITTGTSNVVQGGFAVQKGQQDAAQTEAQYISQTASTASQATAQQLVSFFSKVADVIAAMAQGAKANPQ